MARNNPSQEDRITIWVRCSDPTKLPALHALEDALRAEGDPIWLEVTLPDAAGDALAHPSGHRRINAFCQELMPRALLWLGGQIDPQTVSVCQTMGIKIVVADAGIAMLPRMGRGWFPGKTRAMLAQFHTVFARTKEAADALIRAGVHEGAIRVIGTLEETGNVLPYDEDVRFAIAQNVGPRPIWLAACIDATEAESIAKAQRQAALRAHRLLCLVSPSDDTGKIADAFTDQGLNVSFERDGAEIEEATQVFITKDQADLGLWSRLAPITFIGGSQSVGSRLDPFSIATVGSVVIHGRQVGPYGAHFDQLINANATFLSERPDGLGPAVAHLLSADKAAKYAQAGWDVTSRGAEVVNTLSETLLRLIEETES